MFIINISFLLAKTECKHSPRVDATFLGKTLSTCDVSNNVAGLGPVCDMTVFCCLRVHYFIITACVAWTGFIWIRTGTNGGLLRIQQRDFGLH